MRVGFLITARLKSSRLSLKLLKDLNGKTVIERVIDRAKQVHAVNDIVLCTSPNPQDLPLTRQAAKSGIYCFHGSEDDVLRRLTEAARHFGFDYAVLMTADNPLFSVEHCNQLVDWVRKSPVDYLMTQGLPLGTAPYLIRVKAFEVILKIKEQQDTEYWPEYFRHGDHFELDKIEVGEPLRRNYRLTLDTEEDYEVMSHLYRSVPFKDILALTDALEYLDNHPELAQKNNQIQQKWLDEREVAKISTFFSQNRDYISRTKNEIYRGS